MGVRKKSVRKCARPNCGRVALVTTGQVDSHGRFYCSPKCAPVVGPRSSGPVPDGHEERIQRYMQRAAEGLPLFDSPRRRAA